MPYTLRHGLSFCRIDDHLIFLDTQNDRYFRLPMRLERPFLAYAAGNEDTDVGELIRRSILVQTSDLQDRMAAVKVECVSRSALEQARPVKLHLSALVDTSIATCSIRRQLKTRPLHEVLDSIATLKPNEHSGPTTEQWLIEASTEFRLARSYIPAETRCLLDSLAMVRFLARRKLHASIVFGVTSDPFSAHCWVQAGDLVLNDTVGHAKAHTPIRVI